MAMDKARTNGRSPKGVDEKLGRAVTVKFTTSTFEKVEQRAKQAWVNNILHSKK